MPNSDSLTKRGNYCGLLYRGSCIPALHHLLGDPAISRQKSKDPPATQCLHTNGVIWCLDIDRFVHLDHANRDRVCLCVSPAYIGSVLYVVQMPS